MITAFYHVGSLNHWREIVSEQLRCLGLTFFPYPIHVHYGGPIHEQWFIQRVADVWGLNISFLPNQPEEEERPALRAAQRYALTAAPDELILYFHTKGITHLNDWTTVQWRWMMNALILTQWQDAERILKEGAWDFVAPQISTGPMPHSAGNFWLATADYVKRLPNFHDYFLTFLSRYSGQLSHGWSQRHAAEGWIGSGSPLKCHQLIQHDVQLWNYHSWCANVDAQAYATRHGS